MSDNIRINVLNLVHAFFATPRGKVVEAALSDPDMRRKCFETTRDYCCTEYRKHYAVDSGAWSEIERQVAMYVREFVDGWEA